jgi:chaperonin GroES
MKPLRDVVLIRPDEAKTQTETGILLQEDWKTLPPTGVVEAVGDEVTDVKPGDRVMFLRYSVIDAGDGLKAAKEQHIIARIEDGEDPKN